MTADVLAMPAPKSVPSITATGLTARSARGPIFTDISITVPRGHLVTVVGRSGTGRSSLLLALAGRFPIQAGDLAIGGQDPRTHPHARHAVAVARITPIITLDDSLTVGNHIAERKALNRAVNRDTIADGFATLGIAPEKHQLIRDLSAPTALLTAVALALAESPRVVVVDDVDAGLTDPDFVVVGAALARATNSGVAIIATATRPVPGSDQVVELVGNLGGTQ